MHRGSQRIGNRGFAGKGGIIPNPIALLRDRLGDPMTIGALTASRIASVPSDAKKRGARSATMIEIETGRDYHISGGTDWFEIHDGVVFTVQRTAKVAWAEGAASIGAGLWLITMGKAGGFPLTAGILGHVCKSF